MNDSLYVNEPRQRRFLQLDMYVDWKYLQIIVLRIQISEIRVLNVQIFNIRSLLSDQNIIWQFDSRLFSFD